MIYELNGKVIFDLRPDVMQELVRIVGLAPGPYDTPLLIGLANFKSALQCELDRMAEAPYSGKIAENAILKEADPNADLLG